MLRLRAFGSAAVERDAARLEGLSGQRKAVALLTLLAVAGEPGLSRDRVVATLWPESDETRARGALKQLVHAVRQQLGVPEVLVGTADLRLNPECIGSDVADFDAALRAGDAERAVALYAGPLLDGFHLRDAAEFERWADVERAEYARRYDRALETLADAATASGDHVGAVQRWSRLAASAPLDARVAVRLMTALANAGDQAAALRHGRTYETLVRGELGAPADPSVGAAMVSLSAVPLAGERAAPVEDAPAARARQGPAVSVPPSRSPEPNPKVAASAEPTLAPESAPPAPMPRPTVGGTGQDRRRAWALPAAAVAGALTVAVLGGYVGRKGAAAAASASARQRAATPVLRTAARPSVGVLPFANTSGDPADEPFSDGLTDELIGALGRVPGLKVSGRTSAFALKGKGLGVRAVADTLRVGAVLEGSVRRAGDRLRVTAQLVNAADDSVLWAETYDRAPTDIFAVQEDIAQAIVGALQVKLGGPGRPLVRQGTADSAAYELYLKGRYFSSRPTGATLRRAVGYFEQAIARDSAYPAPYAGLADARALLVLFAGSSPREELPRARVAAAKALALDSTLAEAHAALAHVLFAFDWNWPAAGREYERAIALDPGYATGRQRYGIYLLDQGRFDEAAAALTEALAIDPLSAPITMTLGRVEVSARRPGRAVPRLLAALELNPELSFAHQQLGHAYLQQGMVDPALAAFRRAALLSGPGDSAQLAYAYALSHRRAEAEAIVRQLLASGARRYVPPFGVAMAYVGLGDSDAAFRWLERGYEERAAYMDMLNVTPAFDPLRADPRFGRLLRRMRLRP